jgi:hypothetical protein
MSDLRISPASANKLIEQAQTLATRGVISNADAAQVAQRSNGLTESQAVALQAALGGVEQTGGRAQIQAFLAQSSNNRPAQNEGPARNNALQSLIASKRDPDAGGKAAESLLQRVVDHFPALAQAEVGGSNDLIRDLDLHAVVTEPARFTPELVALAKDIQAHPGVQRLADWTYPTAAQVTHDYAAQLCEFQRALALTQDRKGLTSVVDHLLKNFDALSAGGSNFALEKKDVDDAMVRLSAGNPKERAIAAAYSKVYAQVAPSSSVPPLDVGSLLCNASGNQSTAQPLVTRDGLVRLRAILNGQVNNWETDPTLKVDPRRAPVRSAVVDTVLQHFDAMAAASTKDGPYLSHLDPKAIADKPAVFSAEVQAAARSLAVNGDLLDLADWVSSPGWAGAGMHDRLTEKTQWQSVGAMMQNRGPINAAVDHLLKDWDRITFGGVSSMDRAHLTAEMARLKTGTPQDQALAAELTRVYAYTPNGAADCDLLNVLMNASGTNGVDGAITQEGLARFKNILNRPGERVKQGDGDGDADDRTAQQNTVAAG